MQPSRLALQVIATHTGGLVLDSSGELNRDLNSDLDRDIKRCAQEVRSFYNLTFNPPHTDTGWTSITIFVCRWLVLP